MRIFGISIFTIGLLALAYWLGTKGAVTRAAAAVGV